MRSPPCTALHDITCPWVGAMAPDPSCDLARAGYDMQTNAIPASAPGDPAPTSEEPAPIKMTKPVRTVATAHSPHSRVHEELRAIPTVV